MEKSSTPWIAGLSDRSPSLTLRWVGNRSINSISLGLSRQASRPTEVTVTSPTGSRTLSSPTGWRCHFCSHDHQHADHPLPRGVHARFNPPQRTARGRPTASPKIGLPVGLSSIGVPALQTQAAPSPSLRTPVSMACGTCADLKVDGASLPTQVTGTYGNLVNLQPLDIRACTFATTTLTAGQHVISFPAGSAFRVTSVLVSQPSSSTTQRQARGVGVMSWTPGKRTLRIGAGPATYVQVAQSFNSGWVATFDGRTLKAVSLSGWEQGWILPAGVSGVMTMTLSLIRHTGWGCWLERFSSWRCSFSPS